jgi:hypothetical protein
MHSAFPIILRAPPGLVLCIVQFRPEAGMGKRIRRSGFTIRLQDGDSNAGSSTSNIERSATKKASSDETIIYYFREGDFSC